MPKLKNIPLESGGYHYDTTVYPMDEHIIANEEKEYAAEAIAWVLNGDVLTETQYRRSVQHFVYGMSYREIAYDEGVFFTSVAESISHEQNSINNVKT